MSSRGRRGNWGTAGTGVSKVTVSTKDVLGLVGVFERKMVTRKAMGRKLGWSYR